MSQFKKDIDVIYNRYYKDIYFFCYRMCENNESLAEELTQNAFFKAFQSADFFRGNCSVKTWLCQIAHNDYISYLRKIFKQIQKRIQKIVLRILITIFVVLIIRVASDMYLALHYAPVNPKALPEYIRECPTKKSKPSTIANRTARLSPLYGQTGNRCPN